MSAAILTWARKGRLRWWIAAAVVLLVAWSLRHRWTAEGRADAEVQRAIQDARDGRVGAWIELHRDREVQRALWDARLSRVTPEGIGELEREASEAARKRRHRWGSSLTREVIRKDSIWERAYRDRIHNRLPGSFQAYLPAVTSPSHRWKAASLLFAVGPDTPDLCIQLLAAARDPDAENRYYIVAWVGFQTGALERHLSEFIEMASDPDPTVRQTVAMQLGRVAGSSPAVRAALERLRSDQVSVVREAAEAALLGSFDGRYPNGALPVVP